MNTPTLFRRIGLGALALALVGTIAYVVLNAGPLAPIRVTAHTVVPLFHGASLADVEGIGAAAVAFGATNGVHCS